MSPSPCLLDGDDVTFTRSGHSAILLALRHIGVGPGDRVLVPTYHCATMVAPIERAGATPVFFPIDRRGGPNLMFLERMAVPGVKAILAAHYFGIPLVLDELRAVAERRGFSLIEDCAHAMFGAVAGRRVGGFGHFAIGSLPKFFPVPEGGCLTSNTGTLADIESARVRWLAELKAAANTFEASARFQRLPGLNSSVRSLVDVIARARDLIARQRSGASPVLAENEQAASLFTPPFLEGEPPRFVKWVVARANRTRIIGARRDNYAHLARRLAGLRGAHLLMPDLPDEAVPYVFPLWVDAPEPVHQALRAQGLPIFRWEWLWPSTPEIDGDEGRRWAHHVFQLPCHQALSQGDLEWICSVFEDVLGRPV